MTVMALDGTQWEVTRRADGVGLVAAVLFVALTVAAWTLALVFGQPSALVLLELAALVVLLVPGRRDYVVAARNTTTGEVRAERIRGWRASMRARRELARELSGRA
jgi:hypothetical protein